MFENLFQTYRKTNETIHQFNCFYIQIIESEV